MCKAMLMDNGEEDVLRIYLLKLFIFYISNACLPSQIVPFYTKIITLSVLKQDFNSM